MLDEIQWRATRGSYFEGTFLSGSLYAKQAIEEDVPILLAEIRQLQAEDLLLTQQAKAMRDTLLEISGLISAAWGDADFELPNGIQGIFNALETLDKKSPDWQCREF